MSDKGENARYDSKNLETLAAGLLSSIGMVSEKSETVARILVEGDLLGHTTHGLQLLPAYLDDLDRGKMKSDGEPSIVSDNGSAITWDGQYLPGPWLTVKAMELAFDRIVNHPVVTVVIRKSHHIGCLAAYPKLATDRNLLMWLSCSDPSVKTVAPFGGLEPVYTPNPIAAGIPTETDPIIFDISMSSVANGIIAKAKREDKKLTGKWIQDNKGNPSDDPSDCYTDPPGTVLPLGGAELGYKGFALGLFVESITSALAGHGRSDEPGEWGASVFLQVINPGAFGGTDFFLKETSWFKEACKSSTSVSSESPVRLPGESGFLKKKNQLKEGVTLAPDLVISLQEWAEKCRIPFPGAL